MKPLYLPYNYRRKQSGIMPTLRIMSNYVDSRSILACMGVVMLNWIGQLHFASVFSLGLVTVKVIMEFLGSVLTISTIIYNVVKAANEVKKFLLGIRWLQKKKKREAEPVDPATFFADETPKP